MEPIHIDAGQPSNFNGIYIYQLYTIIRNIVTPIISAIHCRLLEILPVV